MKCGDVRYLDVTAAEMEVAEQEFDQIDVR